MLTPHANSRCVIARVEERSLGLEVEGVNE